MSTLQILKKADGYWLAIDGKKSAMINLDGHGPIVMAAIKEASQCYYKQFLLYDDVITLVKNEVKRLGGQKALAEKMFVNESYVSVIITKLRKPGPALMNYFDLYPAWWREKGS